MISVMMIFRLRDHLNYCVSTRFRAFELLNNINNSLLTYSIRYINRLSQSIYYIVLLYLFFNFVCHYFK
jgi:hypothetical protein